MGKDCRSRNKLVEMLIRWNESYSQLFCSDQLKRKYWRSKHKTKICVFKCMDGRIHIPHATRTPLGIIKVFRNLGGAFEMGWSYLSSTVDECVEFSVDNGEKVLFLITYHFSRGDKHRGCAGHDYDTEKAKESAFAFKKQLERIYGSSHEIVCPMVVGFETDLDALILHGDDGRVLDLSDETDSSEEYLFLLLSGLFKKMPADILSDFLPLVQGNIKHIADIRQKGRPILDVQHRESVLAVGRGLDWLHKPNKALIIGPYQPNLDDVIRKGLSIIRSNLDAGRISKEEGVVALASATFPNPGIKRNRAVERAIFLRNMIMEIIDSDFHDLKKYTQDMAVVLDLNTQKFEEV